jgi:hypothetical protein
MIALTMITRESNKVWKLFGNCGCRSEEGKSSDSRILCVPVTVIPSLCDCIVDSPIALGGSSSMTVSKS